jgi:C-terminal processing protease CtpA/Prc
MDEDIGVARRVNAAERAARVAAQQERGWLGISFTCDGCVIAAQGDEQRVVASAGGFRIHDVVVGGPAARAGVRAGDVLTHVQGHEVGTQDAWTATERLRPGDRVVLSVTRSGRHYDIVTVAGTRPVSGAATEMRSGALIVSENQDQRPGNVTFSGSLGDVEIQVTGPVTVTRTGEEVIIEGENVTVRLRRR